MSDILESDYNKCIECMNFSGKIVAQKNALEQFATCFLPKLRKKIILECFMSQDKGSGVSLKLVLFRIISGSDVNETCKLKAIDILTSLINKAFPIRDQLDGSTESYVNENIHLALIRIYIDVCDLFNTRSSQGPICADAIVQTSNKTHGGVYCAEISEEIKRSLIQLVLLVIDKLQAVDMETMCNGAVLSMERAAISVATAELCNCLAAKLLLDPCADLSRDSCLLVRALSKAFPDVLFLYGRELLQPIVGSRVPIGVPNILAVSVPLATRPLICSYSLLQHRHSKTRCLALEVSYDIISCYCMENLNQESSWSTVNLLLHSVIDNWEDFPLFDRSMAVRVTLARVAGNSLNILVPINISNAYATCHPKAEEERKLLIARLITLLLYCMSDEMHAVSSEASAALAKACSGTFISTADLENSSLHEKLSAKQHDLIFAYASEIISNFCLKFSSQFELGVKKRALESLCTFLKYFHSYSLSLKEIDIDVIIHVLHQTLVECETVLFDACTSCAQALGGNLSAGKYATDLFVRALSEPLANKDTTLLTQTIKISLSSARHLASGIYVISGVMKGFIDLKRSGAHVDRSLFAPISPIIANVDILDLISTSKEVATSLLYFCHTVIAGDCVSDVEGDILTSCIILLGCPENFGLRNQASALLHLLSSGGADDLFGKYFFHIVMFLTRMLRDKDNMITMCWRGGDPYLSAFEILLRNSGSTVISSNFHLIVPIFEQHLSCSQLSNQGDLLRRKDDEKLNEMKIVIMTLLEAVIADETCPCDSLKEFSSALLEKSIIPNLIWKTGGKASAVRKLTSAALFTILRRSGLTEYAALVSLPKLFPILKTSMEDDDPITRELVCLCMAEILKSFKISFDFDAVNHLYPIIMRCLEDNNEHVRLASCAALKQLLQSLQPETLRGSNLLSIVDTLFVHLDDDDDYIQSAVFEILAELIKFDATQILLKAESLQRSHRIRTFCDRLISLAVSKFHSLSS